MNEYGKRRHKIPQDCELRLTFPPDAFSFTLHLEHSSVQLFAHALILLFNKQFRPPLHFELPLKLGHHLPALLCKTTGLLPLFLQWKCRQKDAYCIIYLEQRLNRET